MPSNPWAFGCRHQQFEAPSRKLPNLAHAHNGIKQQKTAVYNVHVCQQRAWKNAYEESTTRALHFSSLKSHIFGRCKKAPMPHVPRPAQRRAHFHVKLLAVVEIAG